MTTPRPSTILLLGLVTAAGCAIADPDGADDSEVSDDELGGASLAWSHPGWCSTLLADDGVSVVLHCRKIGHTLEVLDAATGAPRWTVQLQNGLGASAYTHDDQVWLWIADATNGSTHRRVFSLDDGAITSDVQVPEIPVDVKWDDAGNRYEIGNSNGGLPPSMQYWTRIASYAPSGEKRWGDTAFAQQPFGITGLFLGSDGNTYVAAREQFKAYSPTGTFMWGLPGGAISAVFLAADGSPVVMRDFGTGYFPTSEPLDPWGNKLRIDLSYDRVTANTTIAGSPAFVVTNATELVIRGIDGTTIATTKPSTAIGKDGLEGPEFGLLPMAGTTGSLIQTPTGIGLVRHGATTTAWKRSRFFLPVAAGTGGFVGVCTRPPARLVDGPSQVGDVATFCGLSENGAARWRVTLPWPNYGVSARSLGWQVSRWQGDRGVFLEAPAAKRWIVSSVTGTHAIRTN